MKQAVSFGYWISWATWTALSVTTLINIGQGIGLNKYEAHFTPKHPPHFLQPCHRRHKRFNLCVKSTLQTFFTSVANGSSELNMPPLDPLYIPEIDITEGSGDVSLDLHFQHVSIRGFAETKVVAVRSNLEDYKFEITLKYPFMNFTGDYTGHGSVKTFPVVGSGQFYLNMSDVSAAWIIYFSEPNRDRNYFTIDNFIIDVIPVEIAGKFGNAIDDDDKLGEALNGFFNENAQEIFKVAKPKISEALGKIFVGIGNQVLSKYPAEMLLPS